MLALEKSFVLKGCAGLGNRLSSLTWAIEYCLRSNRTLYVDWTDGTFAKRGVDVFARYFELKGVRHACKNPSLLREGQTVFPEVWENEPTRPVWELYQEEIVLLPRRWRVVFRILSLNRWDVSNVWVIRGLATNMGIFDKLKSLKSGWWMPLMRSYPEGIAQEVVFGADYNPPFKREIFLKHVAFKPDVLAILEEKAKQLGIGTQTLGIHVRQTDWPWGEKIDVLLGRLRKMDNDSRREIFVATDSQEALEKIQGVIGRVKIHSKYLPQGEDANVGLHQLGYNRKDEKLAEEIFMDTLVDMYLLSRCGELWHQRGSTFSQFSNILAPSAQKILDWGKDP